MSVNFTHFIILNSIEQFKTYLKMQTFKIKGEFIELIQLLKVLGIAETGGHAKIIVDDGLVKLNGEVEYRKRAKLRPEDKVEVNGEVIMME